MFYLFKDGVTDTMCADKDRLFELFKEEVKTVVKDTKTGKEKEKISYRLPDGYVIKEYNEGAPNMGLLYLDDSGEVAVREIQIDKAAELEQKKAAVLAQLDAQYQADKEELASQYLDAAMSGDTDTLASIKEEIAELNSKYDADYTSLNGSTKEG